MRFILWKCDAVDVPNVHNKSLYFLNIMHGRGCCAKSEIYNISSKRKVSMCDKLLTWGFAFLSSEMHYYMVVRFNLLNYKTSHSHLWSICITIQTLFIHFSFSFGEWKHLVSICLLCTCHSAAENWSFEFKSACIVIHGPYLLLIILQPGLTCPLWRILQQN